MTQSVVLKNVFLQFESIYNRENVFKISLSKKLSNHFQASRTRSQRG